MRSVLYYGFWLSVSGAILAWSSYAIWTLLGDLQVVLTVPR